MKGGILCAGGAGPEKDALQCIDLQAYEITAAADSGYHLAEKLGLEPHIIVGDMDSINIDASQLTQEMITFPHDKDYTDTQLGCMALLERGCSSILLLGGGEGRLDHTLDLYHYLSTAAEHADIHWITRCEHVWFLQGATLTLESAKQSRISLFPFGSSADYVTKGLLWKAEAAPYSLSNRLTDSECRITVKQGVVAVILPVHALRTYRLGE